METAIFYLCKWGWKNEASACVHLLNGLNCPKLQSCQWKHLYYEVRLLCIVCALAHPLIRTERTWNWALHLQTIQNMLPYMEASGHNIYTTSARVYLQPMANLKEEHPYVQQRFEGGLHVIRRSDHLWAGLSPDLIIEQVLMRSMKTSGGLTRGRGLTEQQGLLCRLLSMPACVDVNQAMQELTGVNYNIGEQNKDMSKARNY